MRSCMLTELCAAQAAFADLVAAVQGVDVREESEKRAREDHPSQEELAVEIAGGEGGEAAPPVRRASDEEQKTRYNSHSDVQGCTHQGSSCPAARPRESVALIHAREPREVCLRADALEGPTSDHDAGSASTNSQCVYPEKVARSLGIHHREVCGPWPRV